ncbi:MAG: hypothetical protein WB630_07130, partial [Candidatus Acidiferrales bacterium]
RVIQSILLEGKKRLAPCREFGNERASTIGDKDVAEGVRSYAGRVLQLAWAIPLNSPFTDIL